MEDNFKNRFLAIVFVLETILVLNGSIISAQENVDLLERFVYGNDSIVYNSQISGANEKEFVFRHLQNDILFYLNKEEDSYYSFFLEGYDSDWSNWTEYPVKGYTNLSSGKYTLFARTGLQGKIEHEDLLLSFTIKMPLYLSPVFLVIYVVLLFSFAWFIYRLLLNRHINRQLALEQLVNSRTEELNDVKEKTEALLANVLPKGTADEIMTKGKAVKKKYNFATVLFSDIQGFTKIAEETNPEILIDELDKFFFYFDTVVEKYNIEKIKTIGDAYMCAGGIPVRNRTNPIEVILAALEMQVFMEELKKEQQEKGQTFWDIRIGLHTGTVIAGVVGQKKLSYDIWGDTVNIASRMESSGEAGKINISGITYEYAKEFFICEYRGKMPVKYKGELDMYFVNGIRPELRLENKNEPNSVFTTKLLMVKLLDLEDYIFAGFEKNSSDHLVFHDIRHLKNVSTQAELIGRAEMLDDENILKLRLASIFVLSGYLRDYSGFQSESIKILKAEAPSYGFNEDHISSAVSIIEDALSSKQNLDEGRILNDSIYDYYGRVDFIIRLEMLFSEEKEFTSIQQKSDWFEKKANDLAKHEFNTTTAKLLRTNSSEKQLNVLKDHISNL